MPVQVRIDGSQQSRLCPSTQRDIVRRRVDIRVLSPRTRMAFPPFSCQQHLARGLMRKARSLLVRVRFLRTVSEGHSSNLPPSHDLACSFPLPQGSVGCRAATTLPAPTANFSATLSSVAMHLSSSTITPEDSVCSELTSCQHHVVDIESTTSAAHADDCLRLRSRGGSCGFANISRTRTDKTWWKTSVARTFSLSPANFWGFRSNNGVWRRIPRLPFLLILRRPDE